MKQSKETTIEEDFSLVREANLQVQALRSQEKALRKTSKVKGIPDPALREKLVKAYSVRRKALTRMLRKISEKYHNGATDVYLEDHCDVASEAPIVQKMSAEDLQALLLAASILVKKPKEDPKYTWVSVVMMEGARRAGNEA